MIFVNITTTNLKMQVKNLGEVGRRGETGVIERESGKKSRVVV